MQAKWITCVPSVAMILLTMKTSRAETTLGFCVVFFHGLSRRQRSCDAVIFAGKPTPVHRFIITFFDGCCYSWTVAANPSLNSSQPPVIMHAYISSSFSSSSFLIVSSCCLYTAMSCHRPGECGTQRCLLACRYFLPMYSSYRPNYVFYLYFICLFCIHIK